MEKNKKEEKENFKEKENENKNTRNNVIITSRVLFIDVLDKIFFVLLLILLFGGSFGIFSGNEGFFSCLGSEIIFLIMMVIVYYFYNWIYKCLSKTMLCLTEKEVYKESYLPFIRMESSIPLNKITGVSVINYFWIFKLLIIHQYQRMPLLFWTGTNQDFKDRLDKLVTTTTKKEKPINENKDKDIIEKDKMVKTLKFVGIALGILVLLFGINKTIKYFSSSERLVKGTYVYEDNKIILNGNGTCKLNNIIKYDINECRWSYNKNDLEVKINYTYDYDAYFGNEIEKSASMYLKYDDAKKAMTTGSNTYTKK